MSTQITTAFVQQYKSGVEILSQQRMSRLRNAVRVESGIVGKNAFFDQIGATEAEEATGRHDDTPLMNTPHARRRVTMRTFRWSDLVDDPDKVRTLNEMTSPYQRNAAMAMGRSMDRVIIGAAFATAATGETGSGSAAFDATNFQITSGSAGLTIAKLRTAKRMLDAAENEEGEARYIALKAKQVEDLLKTTEVTSSDYNTVKALVQGEINTFMGFNFIRTELIGATGAEDRVIAWTKSALLLGIARDMTARISERADKNYSTQVFTAMDIGATRMREDGVVEILCA